MIFFGDERVNVDKRDIDKSSLFDHHSIIIKLHNIVKMLYLNLNLLKLFVILDKKYNKKFIIFVQNQKH